MLEKASWPVNMLPWGFIRQGDDPVRQHAHCYDQEHDSTFGKEGEGRIDERYRFYHQVHINSLEVKGCPGSVLQNTGDNLPIDRRYSDARQGLLKRRPSGPSEPDYENNHNLPQMLQVLDKVDQSSAGEPGERCGHFISHYESFSELTSSLSKKK